VNRLSISPWRCRRFLEIHKDIGHYFVVDATLPIGNIDAFVAHSLDARQRNSIIEISA
jgi:hypothetical protein